MDDVRVIQCRCGACFLLETTQTFSILDETSREEFQRYLSMELSVFSEIDLSHPAFAQQRNNLIMGHGLTCLEFIAFHQHVGCRLVSRCVDKVTGLFMGLQQ